jgi:alpha-L-fucosidase
MRNFKQSIGLLLLALALSSQLLAQKFEPTLESFKQYQYPEWFRDA